MIHIEEFFDSIQGEGWFSGYRVHFIRVHGCNARKEGLECAGWCDTKYAWEEEADCMKWNSAELYDHVMNVDAHMIVFTGGEPLLYMGTINPFLLNIPASFLQSHLIAFETNGTIKRNEVVKKNNIWWTVSPKPPEYTVTSGPVAELKIIVPKWVLDKPEKWHEVYENKISKLDDLTRIKFFQPQDNDLEVAKFIAKELLSHPLYEEWRLGMQLHKTLEVR